MGIAKSIEAGFSPPPCDSKRSAFEVFNIVREDYYDENEKERPINRVPLIPFLGWKAIMKGLSRIDLSSGILLLLLLPLRRFRACRAEGKAPFSFIFTMDLRKYIPHMNLGPWCKQTLIPRRLQSQYGLSLSSMQCAPKKNQQILCAKIP